VTKNYPKKKRERERERKKKAKELEKSMTNFYERASKFSRQW